MNDHNEFDKSGDFKGPGDLPTRVPDEHLGAKANNPEFDQKGNYTGKASAGSAPQKGDSGTSSLDEELKSIKLQKGDILAGRFEIVTQLGKGGMGMVYGVKDLELGKKCALKVMLPSIASNPEALRRFKEEIIIAQELSFDPIIRIYDQGRDQQRNVLFYTMEYVNGVTLDTLMDQNGGKIPLKNTLNIMHQLCDAMEYAHRITIHRDLKPQNVMVRKDWSIEVLDFGLAALMPDGKSAKSSGALGTAYYQAPEQSVADKIVDRRADIYAMGVIMYQLLTGKLPVGRFKDPSKLLPNIPTAIDDVIMKCLEFEASDRFDTAKEMKNALKIAMSPKKDSQPQYHPPANSIEIPDLSLTDPIIPPTTPSNTFEYTPNEPEIQKHENDDGKSKDSNKRNIRVAGILISLSLAIVLIIVGIRALTGSDTPEESPADPTQIAESQPQIQSEPTATPQPLPQTNSPLDDGLESTRNDAQTAMNSAQNTDVTTYARIELEQALATMQDAENTESNSTARKRAYRNAQSQFAKAEMAARKRKVAAERSSNRSRDKVAKLKSSIPEAAQTRAAQELKTADTAWKNAENETQDFNYAKEQYDKAAQYYTKALSSIATQSAGIDFVWLPPGTFTMGSPKSEKNRGDGESQHNVTLAKGFWVGKYEITQAQWKSVMGTNPSKFNASLSPVENVSWEECQIFIGKLNAQSVNRFRLPTEAEWEYACRAGTTTDFAYNTNLKKLQDYAWFNTNSSRKTSTIGSKLQNQWGLHDMHGNVYEWCNDWSGDYPKKDAKDPVGPIIGTTRIARGGSWKSLPAACRSASRNFNAPNDAYNFIGLRLVLIKR